MNLAGAHERRVVLGAQAAGDEAARVEGVEHDAHPHREIDDALQG